MNKQWTLACLLAAAVIGGCATGSTEADASSRPTDVASADAEPTDVVPDLDAEGSGADVGTDTSGDAASDGDGGQEDIEPDATEDSGSGCDVLDDECVPESVRCDGSELVFCGRCGSELRRDSCDSDEICEEVDNVALCRPCVGEECPEVLECQAGERTCVAYNTQQICGPDGRIASVVTCPAGRRCIGGGCVPEGADVGAACEQDSDCAGQACICGTEFRSAFGGADCSPFGAGYCSTLTCDESGCDPGDEACVFAPIAGAEIASPYCVATGGCAARGDDCDGGVCEELPSGETREWALTCWPDVPTIGEACASDADCLGGDCRTRTVSGSAATYCVAPCGDEAACPSHAECVEDLDSSGEFACFARNDARSCPRSETQPILFGGSQPRRRYGGGVATVCYFR